MYEDRGCGRGQCGTEGRRRVEREGKGAVLTPSELAIGYSYRGEGRTLYAIASGERERDRERERG